MQTVTTVALKIPAQHMSLTDHWGGKPWSTSNTDQTDIDPIESAQIEAPKT